MKITKSHHTYLCTFKHLMKLRFDKKCALSFKIGTFALVLSVLMFPHIAKSNPTTPAARLLAFKRAKSLDNGASVSWLEQTWNKGVLTENGLKPTDFTLLKQLGFKSIRLPVAFEFFENQKIPDEQIFSHIDNIVSQCSLYGFKLVIGYHYGNFNEKNYRNGTNTAISL